MKGNGRDSECKQVWMIKFLKKIFRWILRILLGLLLLSVAMVVVYRFVPVYITPLMLSHAVQQMWKGEKVVWEHDWVPLEEISPYLVRAVIASEDNLFLQHHGFDIHQIRKAIEEAEQGKRQRGASTISQQTAKNVFLLPSHSFVRKGVEAYFTLLIEWMWGKERIMEVYLNSIEMGKGIYGAEAVAQAHFSKPASRLTASESALIAATLPNPRRFNSARPSPYIQKRETAILDLMDKIGPVDLKSKSKQQKK